MGLTANINNLLLHKQLDFIMVQSKAFSTWYCRNTMRWPIICDQGTPYLTYTVF